MPTRTSVIIVGGGQAGLSISYCLKERGIDHVVFEKNTIAHSWRTYRWDSFCLVTPNWQCNLPGFPYPGDDPNGFMQKDEIVAYIQAYAAAFDPPIQEGVAVWHITQNQAEGGFDVATSMGDYHTHQVVIAVGGYHHPKLPQLSQHLPESILQIHSSAYKNPQSLPDQAVLVVGTGQSGCQIAEDLHLAGKSVYLCVGSAPRSPRRYRGKDVVEWLDQMGYYDLPISAHPQKETVRTNANHYVTGRDGGREIDLRQFALEGMKLLGRLKGIEGCTLIFQDDLKTNLDQADAVAAKIKQTIDEWIAKGNLDAPLDPPYQPVWEPTHPELTLDYKAANIGTVVWCTGYQSDFSWIQVPAFDANGYPNHERGITNVPGLYVLGLPWLYTWGSGRFSGIARDANFLADYMVEKQTNTSVATVAVVSEVALGL